MSNITITPEDREAAADFLENHPGFGGRGAGLRKELIQGLRDASITVQAFAAARLSGHQQGVAEERERAAGVCEYTARIVGAANGSSIERALYEAATAIRTPNKGEAK